MINTSSKSHIPKLWNSHQKTVTEIFEVFPSLHLESNGFLRYPLHERKRILSVTECNLSDSGPARARICFVWYTYSLLLAASQFSNTWASNPYKASLDFREIEIIFVFPALLCLFCSLHRTCSQQDQYTQFFAMPHLQNKCLQWTHTDPKSLSHKLSETS